MKNKIAFMFIFGLFFMTGGNNSAFALEHTQMDGLFSMDVPQGWRWAEDAQQVVITYPDGKTVAIDIQMVPSRNLSQADIKKTLKDGNDKMIKDGIQAHNGTLIDNKEIKLDGIYATQLDFTTAAPNSLTVTYISLFNKGYAFTITYGTGDDKMRMVLDDILATFKFK